MSLAWRVLLLNSAILVVAALVLALSPATISTPIEGGELVVLLVGVAVTVAANVLLVRRAFAPLDRLVAVMRGIDPLAPGTRVDPDGAGGEVAELAAAFNDMLARLEDERRESARRAVAAQEEERRRLARELHDELGQTLTGVLLQLDEAIRDPYDGRLEQARESARRSLDDVRRIGRDLRPDTLVELGLVSALSALATRFTRESGVPVARHFPVRAPELRPEVEVVVYRVAQEALTNIARHASAHRAGLELLATEDAITLSVEDDGRGLPAGAPADGTGIRGMRERALLVRGHLTLGQSAAGGVRVTLEVPLP